MKAPLLVLGIIGILCAPGVARRSRISLSTPDAFAQGSLSTILGDLTQEITAGSNASSVGSTTIYTPKVPLTGVPALVGSTGVGGLENLLKRSVFNQPFYPPTYYDSPSPNRAANLPSGTSSLNGYAVLPARWNKSLLLAKGNSASDTDLTPISTGTNAFVVPDWILVASDGSNPVSWNPTLQSSGANPVVGRYAYTIYDEGGLLDMTVAGHASNADARQVGYKDSLASADLTQVLLTQSQVDAVVNWRGSHSFAGRQDLINLLTQTIATDPASRASVQGALRYLGIFSRGLGQPSYAPVSRVASITNQNPRPLIQPSAASSSQPGGGNNVGDNYTTAATQDVFSPKLLTLRAEAAFTRNDATAAAVGEPLVKSRFALQRLAWITYNGPSANNLSDPNVQALTTTYGISQAYLQQGTAQNIQNYFGLTWDATNRVWKYNVHNGGSATSASTGSGAIMKLPDVADQQMREPDFFELLKASVDVGALGKASTNSSTAEPGDSGGTHFEPLNYQFSSDVSVDAAIIRVGANIIDQYDLDGYPTRIVFNDGSGAREFRGVENLPYIYRLRTAGLKVRDAKSNGSTPSVTSDGFAAPFLHSGTQAGYTAVPLLDTGAGIVLTEPDIWNPHDQNSSLGNPRPGSSGLIRLVANSAAPDTVYLDAANNIAINSPSDSYSTYISGTNVFTGSNHGNFRGNSTSTGTTGATPPNPSANPPVPYFTRGLNQTGTLSSSTLIMSGSNGGFNYPHKINITNATYLTFNVPDATFFREPTMLAEPDPSGSGLTMVVDPTDKDLVNLQNDTGANVLNTSPVSFKSINTNPLQSPTAPSSGQGFIGIALGTYPLRWVGPPWSGANSGTLWNYGTTFMSSGGSPVYAITYSLQYQDPVNGNWVTYDEKYVDSNLSYVDPNAGTTNQPKGGAYSWVDPRTARFGSASESNIADAAHYRAPLIASTPPNWASTWLDTTAGKPPIIVTERPDISAGFGSNFRGSTYVDWGGYATAGLHTMNIDSAGGVNAIFLQSGLLAQNNPYFGSDGLRFVGDTGVGARDANFWSDPDGVVRRASGGYVAAGSLAGQSLATATTFNGGVGTTTAQSQSRPIILNRPFRSVAELGYVFSGNPWKNVDFSTPESAYSELLDVFCASEADAASAPIAGKVNLNTRQPPVLDAVLAGAYTDEENNFSSSPAWSVAPLAAADADSISRLLVSRTTTQSASNSYAVGPQPLLNVADIVGRWNGSQTITGTFTPPLGSVHNVDGSKSYDGFSADLSTLTSLAALPTDSLKISRLRESAVRALSNVGNTRVWNLMIDIIAQTGEYPQNSASFDQFDVEGSQRYWLHVAIDRLTGAIVDQSLEAVAEVPPTNVVVANLTVPEGQPAATAVGALSATDSNQASTLTYTLVAGTGSDDNAAFSIANNTLQTAAVFRYLDKSSYSIRLRVSDQDSLSFEKAFTVTVLPSAYTQWKIGNFADQANNPAVAGDLVDADHDGLANILEYALGSSPATANAPGFSVQRNGNVVQFNYTRLSAATDVIAHVYWNGDLTNASGWTNQGVTETMLSDDGTLQHWQATVSISSSQRAFLRLQVTRP